MKVSRKIGTGPVNKRLNFGADPDQESGYGSGCYGSGYIRIRIATLIRRALAKVCTVPVLLVLPTNVMRTISVLMVVRL